MTYQKGFKGQRTKGRWRCVNAQAFFLCLRPARLGNQVVMMQEAQGSAKYDIVVTLTLQSQLPRKWDMTYILNAHSLFHP